MHKFRNLRLLLDNDYWGRIGAYIIHKVTDIPIFLTSKGDPGEYVNEHLDITHVSDGLEGSIHEEIQKYLADRRAGNIWERPLPYNI